MLAQCKIWVKQNKIVTVCTWIRTHTTVVLFSVWWKCCWRTKKGLWLWRAAQIVRGLKVDIISNFKGEVYQGSNEQDTVASTLMAIVKKIFDGHSFKHQSETVMPTTRAALSKSFISQLRTVWNIDSRGAHSSYEQFYCGLEIPLSFLCGLQTPCRLLLNYYWTACHWTVLIQ